MKGNYTVYMHTSPSGKRYIGITSKNPIRRWNGGTGYLTNDYFTKSIIKYGWDKFKHEILFTGLTKDEAEQKEIELIAYYRSCERAFGYNIQHGGNSIGKHSEETKRKISIANKGKPTWCKGKHHSVYTKQKLSIIHTGKKLTEETKRKISLAHKGKPQTKESIEKRRIANTGKKRTEEQRKRLSESLKGRIVVQSEETRNKISRTMSIPVLCVETNTFYYGIREAQRKTGISNGSICDCLKGRLKKAGGYHWKYANEKISC